MIDIRFKYYVLNYNHNKNRVEPFNIFNNIHVQEWTEKAVKKYLRNPKKYTYQSFDGQEVLYGFDALIKELDGIIHWQMCGRFEYEMGACNKFEADCTKIQAIDCYDQTHMNIETIAHEAIRQYKQQKKVEVGE